MASKKSKILAIAFCAAVMAGIHVNPVLAGYYFDTDTHVKAGAATVDQETGKVTMDLVNKENTKVVGKVTIDGLASDKELGEVEDKADKAHQSVNDLKKDFDRSKIKDHQQDGRLDKVEDKIDGHTNQISSMGKELDDLEAEVGLQGGQIADLKDDVAGQGQQIGDNTAAIKNHTSVIGVEDYSQLKTEYASTNYISGANDMVEADVILDREISDVNSRVDGIENRVDGLEDRIDKVGAMSAAIANLRTMGYDPAAPTEVAVGVGQYRDETGMALGLFHYPNRDFMLSLSVSTSGDEYMGGIGATWKFGRKSPEKVAEIKKAQAEADARRAEEQKLAKAEEMKKAAKEAKVQAQMERHAKLAAERAALEEA